MEIKQGLNNQPGQVVLFGSGETSSSGRRIFEEVLKQLPKQPQIALLETPAGFELNSDLVIRRVGEFIQRRLQNYDPKISIISARKKGTNFSPDDPRLVEPILKADAIFMGPGSPTYAVRQLQDSLAWYYLVACHQLGAALILASAATVAFGTYALPVYEIYKVGEDLYWSKGLNFFGLYGLSLVFIPHWNNNDGGNELDTSRCFMGKPRFKELVKLLPPNVTIVGIDEKTALIIEPSKDLCKVVGIGRVTIMHNNSTHAYSVKEVPNPEIGSGEIFRGQARHIHHFSNGKVFHLEHLGIYCKPKIGLGIPTEVWTKALDVYNELHNRGKGEISIPKQIKSLIKCRDLARKNKDWSLADQLRDEIYKEGWIVEDTPDGSVIKKIR